MARFNAPLVGMYRYSGSYLSIRTALILFLLAIVFGTIGFTILEGYSLLDGFFMAVITISTVGYEEVKPFSEAGKFFASIYILLNIAVFSYAISAFTAFVIKGEIFKTMHLNLINKKIEELEDHVILCGYGRHGTEVAHHFSKHGIPFVIIESDHDKIIKIRESKDKILYIEGDATHDDLLVKAGIDRAKSLVSVLPDDTENLYTVLTARQLNKDIDIISRAVVSKSQDKLKLAGANHVIMPELIGGFYMASLVTKPGTVDFFSFITNEFESDMTFEVLEYGKVPALCKDKSIRELDIRHETGVNIIGQQKEDGKFIVNPNPDVKLTPGTSFIVLGSMDQIKNLKEYLKSYKD
jgi:voltage-gated potassium channel